MNQNVINEPPNMISAKDLHYIEDMLGWNLLANKKAYFFSENVVDTEIKQILTRVYQMHAKHYNEILGLLQ
ncbi:MAG TPA: spore coat protein [Tenericutes bacterium]|jgi:hypothetical protein|nr:spore coat protein [Mycoplasmatota bacterium]